MSAIFIYILMLIFVIICIFFENKIHGNYLTPFTLLSVPYCLVVFAQIIFTKIYKLNNISFSYISIVFIFIFNAWMIGLIYASVIQKLKYRKKLNCLEEKIGLKAIEKKERKILGILSFICATYLIIFFIYSSRNLSNVGQIVQESFQVIYNGGINFYFKLICMIGAIYFLSISNLKNLRYFILGLYCLLPVILTFVKGIIFIICLGGIVGNILVQKRKVKIRYICIAIFSGLIVFFSVYTVEIGIWDPTKLLHKETYEFIFAKLNIYLTAGVQSFNVNIQANSDIFRELPNPVYTPIINTISKFGILERIDSINNVWVNLGYINNYGFVEVNTNTYIGTLFLYCGFIKGIMVNSFIFTLMYHFFYKAFNSERVLYIVRYSTFSTGLILGWFEYYYMHTFWIYFILIFFSFNIIKKIKI